MPKYLYLLRHAQSVEKQLRDQDKDRELTPTGVKESIQIGAYMLQENLPLDIIIASSAVRAQATAQFAAEAMKFDIEKILLLDELYDASVRTFFEFVTQLDEQYNCVLCVGHNPVISYLAEYLTKAEIGDMATAGLANIKFNISLWKEVSQGNGELVRYVSPAMITK